MAHTVILSWIAPREDRRGTPELDEADTSLKYGSDYNSGQKQFSCLKNGYFCFLPGHMLLNAFKASLRIVLADIGQVEIENVRSIRDVRLWNLDALRDCRKKTGINLG